MISYIFKSEPTLYDWEIKAAEEDKRKREEKKKQKELRKKKVIEESLEPYKNHPISDEIKEKIKNIALARDMRKEHYETNHWYDSFNECDSLREYGVLNIPYSHCQPVYILDKNKNIIDWVESKNEVSTWIKENGYWFKSPGRSTIYEYIKHGRLYKNQLYFVEISKYEEFMEEKSKKN